MGSGSSNRGILKPQFKNHATGFHAIRVSDKSYFQLSLTRIGEQSSGSPRVDDDRQSAAHPLKWGESGADSCHLDIHIPLQPSCGRRGELRIISAPHNLAVDSTTYYNRSSVVRHIAVLAFLHHLVWQAGPESLV